MSLSKLNPVEPPWYGPVCPVVWEGRHREVPPYPDRWPVADIGVDDRAIWLALAKLDLPSLTH